MPTYLIIGNFFSLLAALCIAISVVKKNKGDLILWQLWSIIFSIFACFALKAYAALITCIMDAIRNTLAYKNKLTVQITTLLAILCIIVGWLVNNLGLIGIVAIAASVSYTIFMYTTKNEQQMRWALVFIQVLWIIHNLYIKAYPFVITDLVLALWTLIQIFKNRKKFLDVTKASQQ